MKPLGWILTAVVVGVVASTRRSEAAPEKPKTQPQGKACPTELVLRANTLRVRADQELLTTPGATVSNPVDPAELEKVAAEVDVCLPFTPNRPEVSPADELRSRAALIRARRQGVPTGGTLPQIPQVPGLPQIPGVPGAPQKPPASEEAPPPEPLARIETETANLIESSQKVDARSPEATALLDRIMAFSGQLEQAGLATESARVRNAGQALFRRRVEGGGAVAPTPAEAEQIPIMQQPSTLPDELAARVQAIMNLPQAEPAAADMTADEIATSFRGGFATQIAQLRRRARDLRALRPPATDADAVQMLRLADARPESVSPATMIATADAVEVEDARVAAALRAKAGQIAQQRGITS